ncbi:MAG: hypothetical protein ACD_34C00494G0001 [uncultured bacterium]|nr:MAG: hypothetical protein ACD_34C00494G0001 [uncultured bacterium]
MRKRHLSIAKTGALLVTLALCIVVNVQSDGFCENTGSVPNFLIS